jgi:hypothetical protein
MNKEEYWASFKKLFLITTTIYIVSFFVNLTINTDLTIKILIAESILFTLVMMVSVGFFSYKFSGNLALSSLKSLLALTIPTGIGLISCFCLVRYDYLNCQKLPIPIYIKGGVFIGILIILFWIYSYFS